MPALTSPSVVPSVPGHSSAALAIAQERFWFLNRLDPASSAENVSVALGISGPFNLEFYRRSWDVLLERHDVLRTTFHTIGEQVTQVVRAVEPAAVEIVDLHHVPAALREVEALALAAGQADQPFDLEHGPPYRLSVFRLDERRHVALVAFHHIVCDYWSLGILSRELSDIYTAMVRGGRPALPRLALRYLDYASSHREWANGPAVRDQFEYWRRQLRNATLHLLPSDRLPSARGGRGATGTIGIEPELLAAARRLAAREGATLFMVMLAAYCLVIARYTGHADVTVGVPIANRTRRELMRIVGTFVNTLVFRVDTSRADTFRGLVDRVRTVSVDAIANQDVPFHRLVSEFNPQRQSHRTGLFQTLFNFQNAPVRPPDIPGLAVESLDLDRRATQFDFAVAVDPDVRQQLSFSYDTGLFDRPTVTRFMRHYLRALTVLVAEPDRRLDSVEILTAEELETILVTWNATSGQPTPKGFLEQFAAQVARRPQAPAVEWRDELVSYAGLDESSDRLAVRLRQAGVSSDSVVGICLPRGLDLVTALVAVLKSGAAYLPLDPSFPRERLLYTLQDAGSTVVVADDAQAEWLPVDVRRLDPRSPGPAGAVVEGPVCRSTPNSQLAYVIHTSGSTGQPKGVEVTHGSLANLLAAIAERIGISHTDRVLALTTISFDIAALELFLPLVTGATVVVASREDALDPERLARIIDQRSVTIMQATPTTWRMMVESGWKGSPGLVMLSGGEALHLDLAKRLLTLGRRLWNLYGPTETTIWSTIDLVTAETPLITVGRPIANTQTFILDERLRPVPIGVHGELYIGGAGLARGYLGRPDLTAERFITCSLKPFAGQRLYRTGDRARFLESGQIELLGRNDDQVKVRGFRVELGEVEACLGRAEGVRACAVALQGRPHGSHLVAFVVADERLGPDPATALRVHAARQLPGYMVPNRIVLVPSLPTTPNGKIDRAALPAVPQIDDRTDADGPRTATERTLVSLWSEVLGLQWVGLDEDFFDVGGHSLMAVRLAAMVEQKFGVRVGVASVLEWRTVRQLAAEVDRRRAPK